MKSPSSPQARRAISSPGRPSTHSDPTAVQASVQNMDPLRDYLPDEPCWCGSDKAYIRCHGLVLTSDPGAPVPEEDDTKGVWISPQTRLSNEVLDSFARKTTGVPIFLPPPRPTPSVQRVHPVAVRMIDLPERTPTVSLDQVGKLRFEVLDELGLSDTAGLEDRVSGLTDEQFEELAYAILELAKASLSRLLDLAASPEAPVVLWADHEPIAELLGRTLFWADHYLVSDPLADAMLSPPVEARKLLEGVEKLLALRPLIELGVVVPIPSDFATALTASDTHAATEQDLDRPALVSWLDEQLIVEGPTAREALLIKVRDDLSIGGDRFFLHGHVLPGSVQDEARTFTTAFLTAYQSDFDYQPWIAQSRGKVVADLLQDTNRSIAVATTFGGVPLTRVPFRARLLRQKEQAAHPTAALAWADVPWLPLASPQRLAEISQQDEAVEALRARSRRAFAHARSDDFDRVAAELADELAEAAHELDAEIRTARRWALAGPGAFSALSLGLGATTGVVGGLLAVAGAVGTSLPVIGQLRQQRRRPGYAFVMAKR